MGKIFDPLKCIPSADAVRRRLAEIQEQARKLGILLRTAERIERENSGKDSRKETEVRL